MPHEDDVRIQAFRFQNRSSEIAGRGRRRRLLVSGPLCSLAAASSAGGGVTSARDSQQRPTRELSRRSKRREGPETRGAGELARGEGPLVEVRVRTNAHTSAWRSGWRRGGGRERESARVRGRERGRNKYEGRTRSARRGRVGERCAREKRQGWGGEAGRRRGRLARERRVTHSLRVTYTNRRTSRAGRQLATCSLLCSHTRARINLSVSCHVQCSHSLSPAAHRHSRPSCCRRLRATPRPRPRFTLHRPAPARTSLHTYLAPYLTNKSAVKDA